jgi:hypothetical protein
MEGDRYPIGLVELYVAISDGRTSIPPTTKGRMSDVVGVISLTGG